MSFQTCICRKTNCLKQTFFSHSLYFVAQIIYFFPPILGSYIRIYKTRIICKIHKYINSFYLLYYIYVIVSQMKICVCKISCRGLKKRVPDPGLHLHCHTLFGFVLLRISILVDCFLHPSPWV